MSFILDDTKRNWQAECIFGLFKDSWDAIEFVLRRDNRPMLRISHFENCRERGYTLQFGDKEVSFAEHRRSDHIVVYPFRWNDDDMVRRERNYKTLTKYFDFQQFQEVFAWILKYLEISLT